MEKNHKNPSEEKSVEQNLSKDYIPKSKLGNLPVSPQINDALKKKMDKTNKDIEKFKEEITKKYKFIEAIGLIPAQASKKIEEEFGINEEDSKKGLIHILAIIPERHFKKISEIRLDLINAAKKINDKFWIHVITPIDIWNLGLDSKFEVMEALAMSYPVLDKGLLGALRVTQIHKSMVLKKFEKYVSSYVVGGSLVRGETIKTSDVDVFIIIDDTDVKRMSRLELKEKLRGIIHSYIPEAEAIAGVKNKLSPQIYLMTDFWESVKDAHPIMFTFIRDGIPLYDRGAFLPWKSLLRMGKIKPSSEAVDMFMSSGDKLKETVERRIFDIAVLDLYYGIITPTQGLLMLYGQAPKNPKETVREFEETFVNKEKLIEKKYVDILEEIVVKYFKGMEHGIMKPGDIDGKKLDELTKNALDYIKRIKELREQIEKRVQEKSINETYKDVFGMLENLLKKNSESSILRAVKTELIDSGKFPPKFFENLKYIAKTKKDTEKEASKKDVDKTESAKERRKIDTSRKYAQEITNELIEYTQRCEFEAIDKTRFTIKAKDQDAEVFFLKDTFLVQKQKIQKVKEEKLINSNLKELQKEMQNHKNKEISINIKDLDTIKKALGEFELIY